MEEIHVTLDMDRQPWSDVKPKDVLTGTVERIGLLPHGTQGGNTSVALLIRLPNGKAVIAETTWALFRSTFRALQVSPHNPHQEVL